MTSRSLLGPFLAAALLLAACVPLPPATPAPSPTVDPARPLGDALVRTALAYCTDRAALFRALYPWIEDTAAYTAVAPEAAGAETAALAGRPFVPEQGRVLLGSAAPFTLTVTTTEGSDRRTWIAVWAEQLAACGVRLEAEYRPPQWFYGEKTGLAAGEFQLAAFTRHAQDGASNAVIELPLFHRVEVFAANPQLENFAPPADGIHTRNAALWRIPGRDTIVIGEDAEPAEPLASEEAYVARVIRGLVEGAEPGAAGPYRIREWTHGSRMVLEANPDYTGPAPATPRIVVRFLSHDTAITALLKGQVDILDLETLTPGDVPRFGLDRAAATGVIRLLARPAAMWEVVRFAD